MTALVLALTAPERPSSVSPDTPLLGLPLARRTVLAAERAGFGSIVAAPGAPDALARALAGTRAELLPEGARLPDGAVLLPWNRVVSGSEVRRLAAERAAAGVGIPVTSAADLPRAEKRLLQSLVKDEEGFLSRHFERPISLAFSRRLASTAVTPNIMTIASCAVGVFGSLFFFFPRPAYQTIGALLLVLHSVLDGCDGELARLKFMESRLGGLLDFWFDNVVHCAVFAALAAGWSLRAGSPWPLWLGAASIAGNLAAAGYACASTMRGPRIGPLFTGVTAPQTPETFASRAVNALARRDFIYILLALSLFGKANWFLVPASVGAPAYFIALLALARRCPERKTT